MISLLCSYEEHEIKVGLLAKELGFKQVSLSHEVMPMIKMIPRGFTACADAYLTPHIKKYLKVILYQTSFKYDSNIFLNYVYMICRNFHQDSRRIWKA